VERREAKKQAKEDYKAKKKAAKQEYKEEKKEANAKLKAAGQADGVQHDGHAASSGK
jgi:F0F1-type ATP synthase membrane subunit b/b'